MSRNLTAIFANLTTITGEAKTSIKVDCDNLETVYIQPTDDGRFIVLDGHYTFSYLGADAHKNYFNIQELGSVRINQFCSKHNVELIDLHPGDSHDDCEESFAIGIYVDSDDEIKPAVSAVASCVDAIFNYAMDQRQRQN